MPNRSIFGLIVSLALVAVLAQVTAAAELNVPSPSYPTIQSAISAANTGDVIIVAPGTYYENIGMPEESITLRSSNPDDPAVVAATIIDGGGSGSVIGIFCSATLDGIGPTLSGLTITNGAGGGDGGGIRGSQYGGYSEASIINCVITGNSAGDDGGGVCYIYGDITNCVITDNRAGGDGGGLYYCRGNITDCLIEGNSADDDGGGMYDCGDVWDSPRTISGCVITGNIAGQNGGGVNICNANIENCSITSNLANQDGGGLYSVRDEITKCTISGNRAGRNGGGGSSCFPLAENCIITDNEAGFEGAGFYNYTGTIKHCTIVGNTAVLQGGGLSSCSNNPIGNSIIWANDALFDQQLHDCVTPTYSCIQDWTGGGGGNISADPQFYLPGDYHLHSSSPCLSGVPDIGTADDAEGLYRPKGASYDMGAYEYHAVDPRIAVGPRELIFTAELGGPDPDPQSLLVANCGGGTLNWTVSDDAGWLSASPPSGSSTGATDTVTVSVDLAGLAHGWYSATITVSAAGAVNTPRLIPVRLGVLRTVSVNAAGTGDYPTIQAAIDDAIDGDAVVLSPGTYYENVSFGGTGVTLRSTDPDDADVVLATVLDGQRSGPAVEFMRAQPSETLLSGLTIMNGISGVNGNGSMGAIANCVITANANYGIRELMGPISNSTISGNTASGLAECDGPISDCTISDNSGIALGAGLYKCDGVLRNCTIARNTAWSNGGGMCSSYGALINCIIADNEAGVKGGGLSGHDGLILHCVIANNTAVGGEGGGLIWCDGEITNCIVWDNYAPSDPQIYSCSEPTYSCIQGWTGGGAGNITVDPQFCLPGDYHIQSGSPCIDSAADAGITLDADGNSRPLAVGYDMGAYEHNSAVPSIATAPVEFVFSGHQGGPDPDTQQLLIANAGGGALDWSVSSNAGWLPLDPPSGSSVGETDTVNVSVDLTGLARGSYVAAIAVSAPGAVRTPLTVFVRLAVYDTFVVKADGTGDYPTIQAAIDDSVDGDTIIANPGTYYENIIFDGRRITLRSTDPDDPVVVDATIIDGNQTGIVVSFPGNETTDTVLSGFTITNGSRGIQGIPASGSIDMQSKEAHPTITNCVVTGNVGDVHSISRCDGPITGCSVTDNSGGGMWMCDGPIADCVIARNANARRGAGLDGCNGLITGCIITDNVASEYGGGFYKCGGTIVNCVITGNYAAREGGGLFDSIGPTHCTIADNTASLTGGGLADQYGPINNCIIWGNSAPSDPQIHDCGGPTYSCIQNWTGGGEGNISANPQFCAAGDYYIQPTSPCVDSAVDAGVTSDADGNTRPIGGGFDMGAYEYNPGLPTLAVGPSQLVFHGTEGLGDPDPQQIEIANAGGATLNWSVSSDAGWLQFAPPSGTSIGEADIVTVSVHIGGLIHGSYSGSLTIDAPGATGTPRTVLVNLFVHRTYIIEADGTGDLPTIQAAIDDATYGDTVIAMPGTYYENISFLGKIITVCSSDPDDPTVVASTVIDGTYSGSVVLFPGGETVETVLAGFTITNSYRGISCYNFPKPTIANCIITGNSANVDGAGVYGSRGLIVNCVIAGNSATRDGGGLYEFHGTISNCIIKDNIAGRNGGGLYQCRGTTVNCAITGNYAAEGGGGLFDSTGTTNCTIADNAAGLTGGGLADHGTIKNCIIWGNSAPSDPQIHDCGEPTYSCIQDWPGGGDGNISDDPQFASSYHIQATSPCVDAGDPAGNYADQTDMDGEPRVVGTRVDMGADEVTLVGDLDADGDVDLDDYALLVVAMNGPNQAPGDPNADLDGDGDCDLNDAAVFMLNFTGSV